jgi:hypothetical protein
MIPEVIVWIASEALPVWANIRRKTPPFPAGFSFLD